MPETIEQTDHDNAGQDRSPEHTPSTRWSRTHTIWLLLLLSLAPGFVIALFRDEWQQLPAGVRAAVYLVSAILVVAACSLILVGGDKRGEDS